MTDKCAKCGREHTDKIIQATIEGKCWREDSGACMKQQIANLIAERDRLRGLLVKALAGLVDDGNHNGKVPFCEHCAAVNEIRAELGEGK